MSEVLLFLPLFPQMPMLGLFVLSAMLLPSLGQGIDGPARGYVIFALDLASLA